jgi:hypothetical protein
MGWDSQEQEPRIGETRRDTLRKLGRLGAFAVIGTGIGDLLGTAPARAAGTVTTTNQLPATMVLNALPPDEQIVRSAIENGCCLTYTRDEGHCSPSCGAGSCCYHVVGSNGCTTNEVTCVAVGCATGNFTTGC